MRNVIFLLLILCVGTVEAAQKRALVAGGAGFLGTHLCRQLLQENYEVICLDNLETGCLENIRPLQKNSRFTFIRHDVIHPFETELPLDEIYNFACPAAPDFYQIDPVHTLLTSVMGAYHLLELAKKHQALIFQASTSEIYGDPLQTPQKESYWGNVNPHGIRACYDEGKRAAEALFFDYHRKHGVHIKVARIFNTYGPGMSMDGRVVTNFIVQALKGEPLTVYGRGDQTRSLCYVDDLIRGIRQLMQTPASVTGPMNLGNPEEYTVLDLGQLIIALTGSKSQIIHLPLPQDDPRQRLPDITLAQKMGWSPRYPVQQGLKKTITYIQNQQNVPVPGLGR